MGSALGAALRTPGMQAWLVRISSRLTRQSLQFTDERSKLEGELLGGIDVVKCSAWEARLPFLLLASCRSYCEPAGILGFRVCSQTLQ